MFVLFAGQLAWVVHWLVVSVSVATGELQLKVSQAV